MSEDNLNMLDLLMKNTLPINDKNFKALFDSFNLFDANELEKALFALKNNMNLNQLLANQIDSAIAKDNNLTSQIDNLLNSIMNSDNPEELLNSIFKNSDVSKLLQNATSNLENLKSELTSLFSKNPALFDNINNKALSQFLSLSNSSELSNSGSDSLSKLLDFLFPKETITNNNLFGILKNSVDDSNNLSNNLSKNLDDIFKSIISNFKKEGFEVSGKDLLDLQKELFLLAKEEPSLAKNLLDLFQNTSAMQNLLKNKFSFDFKNSSQEDMNVFFKELSAFSSTLKQHLEEYDGSGNGGGASGDTSELTELGKTIDFLNAIKDAFYLQIPLNINDFNTTAELFVFKDGKNSSSSGKKSASALVAINLLNLGNIEVFLNKIENDLYFQFRLEEDFVEDLIRSNQSLLETYLQDKNLKLKDMKFTKLEESFSIIANEYEEFRQYQSIDTEV